MKTFEEYQFKIKHTDVNTKDTKESEYTKFCDLEEYDDVYYYNARISSRNRNGKAVEEVSFIRWETTNNGKTKLIYSDDEVSFGHDFSDDMNESSVVIQRQTAFVIFTTSFKEMKEILENYNITKPNIVVNNEKLVTMDFRNMGNK